MKTETCSRTGRYCGLRRRRMESLYSPQHGHPPSSSESEVSQSSSWSAVGNLEVSCSLPRWVRCGVWSLWRQGVSGLNWHWPPSLSVPQDFSSWKRSLKACVKVSLFTFWSSAFSNFGLLDLSVFKVRKIS